MIFVFVLVLLALLPLLAVLQYRWLGEVSLGERERMKRNLEASADQFTRDFDHEIRNLYVRFQAGPWTAQERRQDELIEEYIRWRQGSMHQALVDQIYQTSNLADGSIGLMRLDQTEMRLVESEWPEKLERLRREMTETRGAGNSAESIIEGILKHRLPGMNGNKSKGTVLHFTSGPIDEEIPALVLHIISAPVGGAGFPGPPSYRIITLNLNYIKNEFLPGLARRYFNAGENGDYLVSVIGNRAESQPVYSSDEGRPVVKGDVSRPFLRVALNEPDKMLIAGMTQPDKKPDKNLDGGVQSTEKTRVAISVTQSDIRLLSGQVPKGPTYITRSLINNASEGRWRLVIKHRSGSLEAAVTSVRRRNMAISFGILVLLGISMGFILMSTRRAQRLATQQMEFVAGVSHELRTPLAVICSAAENLADGVVENPDQTRRYGGLIRDEGRRLTDMVEQVLEFAGAQSGRKTYQLRPLPVAAIVEDALHACRQSILNGGFEIENENAEDLPYVLADMPALSRAIQNLVNNAVKYCGDSRWIGIKAQKTGSPGREEIAISVSDRGIGIPVSEQAQIFDPFYRGKEVVSAQIHGNGLGLSLVRHIVESHGGRVTVVSRINEGTTFTIYLPIADTQTADIPAIDSDQAKRTYEQTDFAG